MQIQNMLVLTFLTEYFILFNLKSIDCALGIALNQFATEFKMFCHSHGYLFFFKKCMDHIITCFHECEIIFFALYIFLLSIYSK